jgi:hypothetical protein
MSMPRRLRIAVTVLSALVVAGVTTLVAAGATGILGAAAVGGKGFGCGPGSFHCQTSGADAIGDWQPTAANPDFISIAAFRSTFVFRPTRPGGTATMASGTMVEVEILDTSTGLGAFDCFTIPDTDLVISPNLQSASLNATLATQCPAPATPLADIAQPEPFTACCQPGGGLPLPLMVSLTWTGPGAAFTFTSDNTMHCQGFTSTFHSTGATSAETATGTLGFPDGSTLTLDPTTEANVDTSMSVIDSTGQPAAECFVS